MFMEPPPANLAPKSLNQALITIGKKEQFRFLSESPNCRCKHVITHKDKMCWPFNRVKSEIIVKTFTATQKPNVFLRLVKMYFIPTLSCHNCEANTFVL